MAPETISNFFSSLTLSNNSIFNPRTSQYFQFSLLSLRLLRTGSSNATVHLRQWSASSKRTKKSKRERSHWRFYRSWLVVMAVGLPYVIRSQMLRGIWTRRPMHWYQFLYIICMAFFFISFNLLVGVEVKFGLCCFSSVRNLCVWNQFQVLQNA